MSITLTNPTSVVINGVQVENDTIAAATGFVLDYLSNTVTLQLAAGSPSGGNINIGTYVTRIQATVNLSTGAWSSTSGQAGTLSPAGLTSVQNQFKADRNLIETFAVNNGIIAGVQVPWA